jgi:hypothetical protein
VQKLLPGEYDITVTLMNGASSQILDLGDFTFDKPGLVELDLRPSGALIEGVVLDGNTDLPLSGQGWSVTAAEEGLDRRRFQALVGGDGRFSLAGLPEGLFKLTVKGPGFEEQDAEHFEVLENRSIKDFRIKLPPMGKANVSLAGFTDPEFSIVKVSLYRDNNLTHVLDQAFRIDEDGAGGGSFTLKTGWYRADFCYPIGEGVGRLDKRFLINPGHRTELVCENREVSFFDGILTVSGSVSNADGTPSADARLRLEEVVNKAIPPSSPHLTGDESLQEHRADRKSNWKGARLEITCDDQGRFHTLEMKPGRWEAHVTLQPGRRRVSLPDIYIPANPSRNYTLDLVLPSGSVEGILSDRMTGKPFDENAPFCSIALSAKGTGMRFTQSIRGSSRFRIEGVPQAEYTLRINAKGYAKYTSGPLYLGEGQELDLGVIMLDPCGVLELIVKDPSGEAVSTYGLSCDGRKIEVPALYLSPDGSIRHDGLPLGYVRIKITAEGFIPHETFCQLDPGKPVRLEIVLDRE